MSLGSSFIRSKNLSYNEKKLYFRRFKNYGILENGTYGGMDFCRNYVPRIGCTKLGVDGQEFQLDGLSKRNRYRN